MYILKKLTPTKDFLSFASYVAFFPQLVAGPIERATNLLPQFAVKRKFNYEQSIQGFRLIIWGLFKKVVIADTLAIVVNKTFGNFYDLGGGDLWIGAMFFLDFRFIVILVVTQILQLAHQNFWELK